MEFESFPKIPRLKRSVIITEKIDGANAQIAFDAEGNMRVGSRNRWLSAEADNFGFFAWAQANAEELKKLGPGRHFGEWWGPGIQRRYNIPEKRFSLFECQRWGEHNPNTPACCHVVPVLLHHEATTEHIDNLLEQLREQGSVAAPGFMNPEGVVVYMTSSRTRHKITLGGDGAKGEGA